MVVDGNQDDINRFKSLLWQNVNPLLVNIRQEFPYIFSIDQLYEWAEFTDELIQENGLASKNKQYESNLDELDDFEKAIEFNIDLRKLVNGYDLEELKKRCPSLKDEIEKRIQNNEPLNMIPVWLTSSMSTCLEPMRNGSVLFDDTEQLNDEQKSKIDKIKNSYLFKYGNMSMQNLRPGLKPKLVERQVISPEWFNGLSLDEKIDFISKMIYESHSHSEKQNYKEKHGAKFDTMYKPMFDNGSNINESRSRAIALACG